MKPTDEQLLNLRRSLPMSADHVEFARAVLAQYGHVCVEGWVLVPVEPTPDMLGAGTSAAAQSMNAVALHQAYSTMLAAAPKGKP